MMDAAPRPGIRSRRPEKAVSREHFARLALFLPPVPRNASRGPAGPLAFLLLGGFALGVWWPPEVSRTVNREEVFVFEEEILDAPLPLEIPPPAPQPAAPPPPKEEASGEKPPQAPQSGLEVADLSETGSLAVAGGDTPAKSAEAAVTSPPTSPVFLDQQPGILKGTPPEYPARALERGLEGMVVALVTIDTHGRVTEARIEQSAGRDFDGPVLDAVRRLSFEPLVREGRKRPSRFRIPYEFKLE